MSFNTGAINTKAINAPSEFVTSSGGGALITIEQKVSATGAFAANMEQRVGVLSTRSTLATIEQEVLFRSTGGGTIITIEQNVTSKGTPTINIEQTVVSVSDPLSFFERNGYEPRLYIGGEAIALEETHAIITTKYTENDAPQLTFTMIPPTGSQDVRRFRGKTAIFKIREASGITQMFSGKVNVVDVQILDQKILFNCSLDIEQIVQQQLGRNELDKIGLYNNAVFPKPETNLQELRDRISTIPSVLNFRKTGSPNVDPIANAASPDFTLTNSDIYRHRSELDYKPGSGQRYINKVNIKVDYSYQRLHHHERGFSAGVGHTTVCELLEGGYDILFRALVASSVEGSAWPLKGSINYDPIYPAGWYQCSPAGTGAGPIAWTTTSCTKKAVDKVDTAGEKTIINGDTQKEIQLKSCTNSGPLMCTGASWTSTTRWSQNIKQSYTLTVKAPQSITQNGEKEKDINFSLSSSFESSDWEDYQTFSTTIPTGLSTAGTQGNNFWINADTNKTTFDASVNILLNKAKSDILKSHREERVVFRRSLWTAIDMWHTIKVNTTKIVATGRVFSYTHTINCSTGEAYTSVELSMSQSTGSASDSTLTIPSTLTSTPIYPTSTIRFGSGHYGQDPQGPGAEKWTGHIANKYVNYPFWQKTSFPVSFVVDVPPIETSLRQESTLTSSTSYDVEIPNNSLAINFDQWT